MILSDLGFAASSDKKEVTRKERSHKRIITKMATTRYLVVVYVVTAGLHDGDDLGSDEEEIVLFTWLVIDITNCKVSN